MAEEIREKTDMPGEEPPRQRPAPPNLPQGTNHNGDGRGYRSLFWPLVLIGAGLLFLLANLGIIDVNNLTALYRLWPILLIAIGLDVLFGRRSPVLGALLGLAAVGAVVALVVVGPQLGLTNDNRLPIFHLGDQVAEVKQAQYVEAVDGANSANVTLDIGSIHTEITSLPTGSDTLFSADVDYLGTMMFDVRGGAHRSISLGEQRGPGPLIAPPGSEMRWDIGLNPDVSTDLVIDSGSASVRGSLTDLTLTDVYVDSGSGSIELDLPGGRYDTQIDTGSGSVQLDFGSEVRGSLMINLGSGSIATTLGANPALDISVDSGSGSVTFNLPSDGAIQVIVEEFGSGSINLSDMLEMVDDGDDNDPKTGTWQTPGFATASLQTIIRLESIGSGTVNIH